MQKQNIPQQNVYAGLGFGVAIKFCSLNFVHQGGTVTRFENPSRHKHKRWRSCLMTTNNWDKMKEENRIVEPPDELDGAKVIKWAWSGIEPFGHLPVVNSEMDNDSIEIFELAICQYNDSENVYRFSCDKYWEAQQDGVYKSVEDAQRQLPDQYKLVTAKWRTK